MKKRPTSAKKPILWNIADLDSAHPNKLVSAFLTSSYIYYIRDDLPTLMSDADFDWLCKTLLRRWRKVTHPHKSIITLDMLRAGTGFSLREHDFPLVVRYCAVEMALGVLLEVKAPPLRSNTRRESPPRRKTRGKRGFF